MRVLRRCLLSGLVVLAWLSAACAAKEEVIPIIHVSPGFESRLALRPPTGAPVAPAAVPSDAGAPDTASVSTVEPSREK